MHVLKENLDNTTCYLNKTADFGFAYWTSGQQLIKGNCLSPYAWRLPDGELQAFDYSNWNGGEPNCGINLFDYCVIVQVFTNFRWDDVRCTEQTCPLCEYKP